MFSVYCEHANDAEIGRNYDEEEFWLPIYKETADKKWEKKMRNDKKTNEILIFQKKKPKKFGESRKCMKKIHFKKSNQNL